MSIARMIASGVVLSAWSCTGGAGHDDYAWLTYEPTVVELTGKLTEVVEYGPPNFGEDPETDSRLQLPVLMLSPPVNVREDATSELNTESFEGVEKIQLIFSTGSDYSGFLDQEVVVTGSLFQAHLATHFTPVLLTVQDIQARQ